MDKPFQRVGSTSNAHVGEAFEVLVQQFFSGKGVELVRDHVVPIGVGPIKKPHAFDLGCSTKKWLVECKSHRWTAGHNIPSAKLTVWNEAMYYFHTAPPDYKKVFVALKDRRRGTGESLLSYYIRTYGHLIPSGVELWEYDEAAHTALRVAHVA